MKPTQCHLWKKENLKSSDLSQGSTFDVIKVYENESHSARKLVRCKDCGQEYFFDFYEHGDSITMKYFPILENGDMDQNCYIRYDFPADINEPVIEWVGR